MFQWVIKEQLVRGPNSRRKKKPTDQVPQHIVDAWLKKAKTSFGIRSIICLLDQRQMRLYEDLRMDLVSYYRASRFQAAHIPVRNYQHPALPAYQLEKPVLIHCSAGIGRTEKAVSYIKRNLKNARSKLASG